MDGPLRIAIVGCGTVARRQHIPGYKALSAGSVQLTVFASRSPEAAAAAAAQWGGGATVTDWRDALARDDVDAVDICTPNALHAEVAVAAAAVGKHVLVEKPIATSLAEADRMIDAARRSGTALMTAHNGRYAPAIRSARGAVQAGLVGEVAAVEAYLGHGGPSLWAPAATWFFHPGEAGGGSLIDLGVHAVDNVRFVTADEVADVAAMTADMRDGLEFDGHIMVRMKGGALGFVKGSWNAPYGNDRAMIVWGRTAQLVVDRRGVILRRPGGEECAIAAAPPADLYADFLSACAGEKPAEPSGVDGRAALAVVLASYRSAASRAFVRPG